MSMVCQSWSHWSTHNSKGIYFECCNVNKILIKRGKWYDETLFHAVWFNLAWSGHQRVGAFGRKLPRSTQKKKQRRLHAFFEDRYNDTRWYTCQFLERVIWDASLPSHKRWKMKVSRDPLKCMYFLVVTLASWEGWASQRRNFFANASGTIRMAESRRNPR